MRRRDVLLRAATLGTAAASVRALASVSDSAAPVHQTASKPSPFKISLNTATLRAHKLPLVELIDLAARAGYQGIEPWADELDRHLEAGGTLPDLRKRIQDQGLRVTGAVTFFEWMVDDQERRSKGLEEAGRRMRQVVAIGGTYLAAPPVGNVGAVDLLKAAERYRRLLELGDQVGAVPALEIWGGAANLFRLGQAVAMALEAQHPNACVLPDVFHLYRGGSGFASIRQLNAGMLAGFHFNDYPAAPPREDLKDKDRLFPGDGVAPLSRLIRDLRAIGYHGCLSVELFHPAHAQRNPLGVAREGLEKTAAVISHGLQSPP